MEEREEREGEKEVTNMAYTTFEVKKYGINLLYAARTQVSAIGKVVKWRGRITCHGEHNHEDYYLIIYFLDSRKVPGPYYDVEKKTGGIFLPLKEMAYFVDLLRNEKPIYASLNSERPGVNGLFTGKEPVGEGEIAPL